MTEREIETDDGLLKFLISDPLEEYRVKTLLTKEPETISWINNWLFKESNVPVHFWDVGSNIGIYSLYAAAKNPKLHVLSFEPFYRNFIRLKANIDLNKLDNIAPLYIALSNKGGLIDFCGQDDRFGASGNVVMLSNEFEIGDRKSKELYKVKETVLQARGDDLLRLNLNTPNFLKIDVDGLELGIIEGMKDILASKELKSVLIEINCREDLITIKDLFSSYHLYQDDSINMLENHSRRRRSKDLTNTAENWVFTRRLQ